MLGSFEPFSTFSTSLEAHFDCNVLSGIAASIVVSQVILALNYLRGDAKLMAYPSSLIPLTTIVWLHNKSTTYRSLKATFNDLTFAYNLKWIAFPNSS